MECNRQNFLSFWTIFCPFPPYGPRKSKFWKNTKKTLKILSFYTCTINDSHMMYGSWHMECNGQNFLWFWTVFCPFTPLTTQKINIMKNWKKTNTWRYYQFTHVYHKWQSYDAWFLRYQAQQTDFFVILDQFFPFYPPNNTKNQNFEKMKKMPGDISILHTCTINDNHMMYGSWDMEHDRIFCHIVPFFALFSP